ncbi:MAG: aspartate-semialdehyde dehydrogenase [Chloroflexota bacterium]|nr:aspartate-semialdehyde dehydrogenase [Chloroflexota bacterium]
MSYAIGVVGATGQVGREFLRILDEGDRPDLPVGRVRVFASERSAGKRLTVRGDELVVERAEPDPDLFRGLHFVLTAVGDAQAKLYSPAIARAGALNVDKSNAWRMDATVPLVVPEVNAEDARGHHGIIAGPNCSTIQMVVALWPIHQVNPIRRIIVDTYQAVSGTGWRAIDELQAQEAAHQAGEPLQRRVYPHQIHLNVIPEIGSYKGHGVYGEEQKMIDETRKIFHAPDLRISATCVRVPVAVGHSEAIHIELERPMQPDEAREILRSAPGVVVLDDARASEYPVPLSAAGADPVFVGRVRSDPSHARGLALWVVSDNLRKGAALNAVQVFELVARNGWRSPAIRQEVHA